MEKLLISTTITKEMLNLMEPDLAAAMRGHLLARKSWVTASARRKLVQVGRTAAVVGLLSSSLSLYFDEPCVFMKGAFSFIQFHLVHLALLSCFLLSLLLFWDVDRAERWHLAFRYSTADWAARKRARFMLKMAKKSAPFDAEYDFRGDSATYRRNQEAQSVFAWHRRLKGFFLAGAGYTLIFKKEKSLYPYAIILHDQPEVLLTHLGKLGLQEIC